LRKAGRQRERAQKRRRAEASCSAKPCPIAGHALDDKNWDDIYISLRNDNDFAPRRDRMPRKVGGRQSPAPIYRGVRKDLWHDKLVQAHAWLRSLWARHSSWPPDRYHPDVDRGERGWFQEKLGDAGGRGYCMAGFEFDGWGNVLGGWLHMCYARLLALQDGIFRSLVLK
jgi:hypothetical protein